jgi:hypothetical protein
MASAMILKGDFTDDICEGCKNQDINNVHRCRADSAFCVDGETCPDFIGEGNCSCMECV